jgi:DNA-binding HxlR family transcriptional regulator
MSSSRARIWANAADSGLVPPPSEDSRTTRGTPAPVSAWRIPRSGRYPSAGARGRLADQSGGRAGLQPLDHSSHVALHEYGPQRFTELQRLIPAITPKVLTQRLRQLERDGLVVRSYYPEIPPRVEYQITELGRSLGPLFASLAQWAHAYLPQVDEARQDYDTAGRPLPG